MKSKPYFPAFLYRVSALVALAGVLFTGATTAAGSGILWVSNYNSNSLGNYSTTGAVNNASFATSGVSSPAGISYSPFNNEVYVVQFGSGNISEYNTNGTAVSTHLITGLGTTNAEFLAVNATNGDLYIPIVGSNAVKSYSPTGSLLSATFISTGLNAPNGIAISPITGNIFIANDVGYTTTDGYVAEYSPTGVLVNGTLITGLDTPTGLAFDPITGNLYVSNGDNINGPTTGVGAGFIGEYQVTGSSALTVDSHLITGLSQPWQITYDPLSGNFDVPNYSGSSIAQYTPTGALANATLIGVGGVDGIAYIGPVPEPGTEAAIVAAGVLGIAVWRRGNRKAVFVK
jgi:DNA-binding beta-propeller fold protein YncE